MTKCRSKALIYADLADAVRCMRQGKKPKRSTNKDGSINTEPIFSVEPKLEKDVLKDCIAWLRRRGCVADRMNVGAGRLDNGNFYRYGIAGAGDILAYLPNGRGVEIECKHGAGGKWSISQQRRAKKIQRNNALYYIVHGVEELEYFMKGHLNV